MANTNPDKKSSYNDFWIRITGSLLASEIIDALGRDESIFRRLTTISFYTDLLGGFVISLILWEIIRYVVKWLDKKFDWFEQPVQRIALQLMLGIILPALLSFVFTAVFMRFAYSQDIFETDWLFTEFYTVIIIIVFINLIYFTWWLYNRSQAVQNLPASGKTSEIAVLSNTEMEIKPEQLTTIPVTKAGKNLLLSQTDIAYIFIDGSYTFIKTHAEESFVTTYTLDELAKKLTPVSFFRVNRQVIISRQSCAAYENIENGKIQVSLLPENKFPVVVSQKRARDFRKWILNN